MTRPMHKSISRYFATAVTAVFLCVAAAAIPSRPEPARLVNDLAGLFTASQAAELERTLVAFNDSTSNQIAVVTVTDLEGYAPADFATRIGLEWEVGSADFNNGIVILVKPKTTSSGQVFISIGYGLEGAIPDAYAKRIINNEMIPYFMENDYFSGVEAACETLMQLASGEISEPRDNEEDDILFIFIIFFITIIFIIIIVAAANNKGGNGNGGSRGRSILDGPVITIGNDFGGWGKPSGGSFGGFGGSFGGFGGGSFGGGGAGGSW